MTIPEIAQAIKDRRYNLVLHQQDVADKAGITINLVRRIESGRYNYNINTLLPVLKALDLQISIAEIPKPTSNNSPEYIDFEEINPSTFE